MPQFQIKSPDGGVYDVTAPEGATPEQALEKVKAGLANGSIPKAGSIPTAPTEGANEPSTAEGLAHKAGLTATAVGQGVLGLGDTANFLLGQQNVAPKVAMKALPALVKAISGKELALDPGFDPVGAGLGFWKKKLEEYGIKPETVGEKYFSRAVKGAVEGLPFGPAGMVSGATGGAGGEAAVQTLGGGEESPLVRFGGEVIGGLTPAGAVKAGSTVMNAVGKSGVRKHVLDLADALKANIPEGSLWDTADIMEQAKKVFGVNLHAAQAYPGESNLTQAADFLASHSAGQQTQKLFQQQPGQVDLARALVERRLGGKAVPEREAANAVTEAATEVLKKQKTVAGNLFREKLAEAPDIKRQGVRSLQKELQKFAEANPNSPGADLAKTVAKSTYVLKIDPKTGDTISVPITNPDKLKQAIDGAISTTEKTLQTTSKQAQEHFQSARVRDIVNSFYDRFSPKLSEANAAYSKSITEDYNPLKRSVVGDMAGKYGDKPDVSATFGKIQKLFRKGSTGAVGSEGLPGQGISEISQLARETSKVDPAAFPNAFSTWFRGEVASLKSSSSSDDLNFAEGLHNALFKSEAQRQGVRDAVSEIAKIQGADPLAAVKGIEHFAKLVSRASRIPKVVKGISPEEIHTIAGEGTDTRLMQLAGLWMPTKISKLVAKGRGQAVLEEFDKMLTTPEGVRKLAALGKTRPGSKAAAMAMGAIVSSLDQVRDIEGELGDVGGDSGNEGE